MKKLKVLGLAAIAAGMFSLTSCLDGGNKTQSGAAYGVVDMMSTSFAMVAYVDDYTPFYSSAFSALPSGQCVAFSYTLDYDAPENTSGKDYFTVTVGDCIKINEVQAYSYLPDTTSIYEKELTINNVELDWNLIKNRAFLATTHPSVSKDQENVFEMNFDLNNPTLVEGRRVYEVFIRAKKIKDGNAVEAQGSIVNAYNMSSFFAPTSQREKSDGKEDVKFRFNYITSFNKDTTLATWGKSEVLSYTIPTEK